jgi:hypothetical protein
VLKKKAPDIRGLFSLLLAFFFTCFFARFAIYALTIFTNTIYAAALLIRWATSLVIAFLRWLYYAIESVCNDFSVYITFVACKS